MDLPAVLLALTRFYGVLPKPPGHLFPLFVWEVLAARTSPGRRDAAFAAMKRIPALTPDAMWRAPEQKLLNAVLLAGPFVEQRLGALRQGVRLFRRSPRLEDDVRSSLRTARRALEPLPRPGGDSATARLLLFAGNHLVFPVDLAVQRTAIRLGLAMPAGTIRRSIRDARRAIAERLPRAVDGWQRASVYLSHHAAATCIEADPHCAVCPLMRDCAFAQASRKVSANSTTPPGGAAS